MSIITVHIYRFLLVLVISIIIQCGNVQCTPIVDGERVPDHDETFTFSVSLQHKKFDINLNRWNYTHFCGGVLLQVYNQMAYVASASHCLKKKNDEDVSVVFGAKNLINGIEQRFDNVTLHPRDYDVYTMESDFSIIKIFLGTCKLRLNPIRLIMDPDIVYNDECYIFGYGSETVYGTPTLDLRIAPVRIISFEKCLEQLGPYNAPARNSGMFCAEGARPGVDACSGDSGSGLVCVHDGYLAAVGITTYGVACGLNGMPGVYTTIANQTTFIERIVEGRLINALYEN